MIGLRGYIPAELSHLQNLSQIILDHNYITGTIPSELATLLDLGEYNNILVVKRKRKCMFLSSHKAGCVARLSSVILSINDNALSGTLSSEFGGLSSLVFLFIDSNMFTGTLPSELGNLESLRSLSCRDNFFTGTLPSTLGKLSSLRKKPLAPCLSTQYAPAAHVSVQSEFPFPTIHLQVPFQRSTES